jgi:hypothetical protein
MFLPKLKNIPTSRDLVAEFGGYNHNLQIGDGEFYDMKNLTSTYYPVLSPRPKRGTYVTVPDPQGMIAKDSLCYVDGSDFVINEYRIEMGLSTKEEDCPKQLISMGAYVVIMPDKMWINTQCWNADGTFDTEKGKGYIDAEFSTQGNVSFTLCKLDGSDYSDSIPSQSDEPANPENMDMWIDMSTEPHSLKQWSESAGMWVTVPTTYVKISSPGIGAAFEKYDGITITGLKDTELYDSVSGNSIEDTSDLAALEGSTVVWEKGDDYIVVVGILNITRTITNQITISRKMPTMDFIIESENRLFGCRYGEAANGDVVNEIYVSKLGDFKNWNCFMGLSTDSYVASCGTDGQFTGAITHLGYPLFFKENYVHKVYGNYPANFQIQTTACRGVQQGCADSLAIVNEVLYYKSRNGVCAYDGSLPAEISYALGEESYSDAVAVAHGNKYYISMKDANEDYHLFVYDTSKRLWHKEDNLAVKKFCSCQNELYFIPQDSTDIKTMFGSGTVDDKPVEWMAVSGVLGMYTPDKKYISRLNIRMALDIGTKVMVYVQYDSCGEWELVSHMTSTSNRSFSIPIRPRRCDHFRIKIEGEGNGKIYSISKTLEQGSDL